MRTPLASPVLLLPVAFLLLAIPACVDYPAPNKIAIDSLPVPVRAGITKRFRGAELISAKRELILENEGETETETVVYEVEILHQGATRELNIKPDGTIVSVNLSEDA